MNTRKINLRSCDHFPQRRDNRFVQLIEFIIDNDNEITIVKVIRTKSNYYSKPIRDVVDFSDEICVKTDKIWRNCVFLESEDKSFIIPVPNELHY